MTTYYYIFELITKHDFYFSQKLKTVQIFNGIYKAEYFYEIFHT